MATPRQPRDKVTARSRPDAELFKEWLQRQLKVRRMSQRQLAMKAGIDHSCISRLLRGGRVPSLRTAASLARAIEQTDHDLPEFGFGPVVATNATARVEYALRADDALKESDVRDIMLRYLALRVGHLVTATRPRRKPVVVRVADTSGVEGRSEPSDRRGAYHRS
jgi:transcriptional regulator with XRE-family HTH domain